jgi:large subunit ribosomal protein L15
MLITELKPTPGARRRTKRVGRGRASGHGKTSTRGHNGQGQRSGESKRFGFEGGQTPLFRRLPKIHNFNQVINRNWVEVNVGNLNVLPANFEVNAESLVKTNILRKTTDSLRILGNGDLKVALKVTAQHFSAGAKAKIEAAGGTVIVIESEPKTGKRDKRVQKSIDKKAAELKAAETEKAAAQKAKADKAEKGADKKAPPKESKGGGGGGEKQAKGGGGGDKPAKKEQPKEKKK